MKNLTKIVLFISLTGLIGFSVFDSFLRADKVNIHFGGTVNIIHNHSEDNSKISGVIHSADIQQNISAMISESPSKINISENIPPIITQQISNDTPETATPKLPDIPAETSSPENFTFTGWLKTRNSKDTHTFTLTHSCAVNVSFNPSEGDKAYYVLTVTGDSGHVITRKMIDSENLHTDTGNIYLRHGKYTVNIEQGYSWSGKPYRITVSTSRVNNAEQESNNSTQTANVIPLNENISASSGMQNDTDYYTFTLEKPMMICPHLDFNPVINRNEIYSLKFFKLTISSTDKSPFTFRGDGKPSRKIKPFVLDAGKYIIAVSRLEPEELELGLHEYTLRVEAQELM